MSKVGALSGVALALLLVAGAVSARPWAEMDEARDAAFAAADADGDGALTPTEFEAFHEAMREARAQAMFAHHDADGDGKLTADELPGPPSGRRGCDR